MHRVVEWRVERKSFDNGIEKENIGVWGMLKESIGIREFVRGGANGDEMGD